MLGKLTRTREPFTVGTELYSGNGFHVTGEGEFQRVVWFLEQFKKRKQIENIRKNYENTYKSCGLTI